MDYECRKMEYECFQPAGNLYHVGIYRHNSTSKMSTLTSSVVQLPQFDKATLPWASPDYDMEGYDCVAINIMTNITAEFVMIQCSATHKYMCWYLPSGNKQ